MSGFDPIVLEWGGRSWTIEPHKMMGALQIYERAVTPQDFQLLAAGGMAAAPAVVSAAYGALLRYAGARVGDDEVFLKCRQETFTGEKSMAIMDRLVDLQWLRIDPAERERIRAELERQQPGSGEETKPENPPPAG